MLGLVDPLDLESITDAICVAEIEQANLQPKRLAKRIRQKQVDLDLTSDSYDTDSVEEHHLPVNKQLSVIGTDNPSGIE
jgi:hypothetical protein